MDLNATPSSERIHIGIFGKRNAGKSSLINAITGQNLAIVSDTKGTTTDPVYKAMEILPLGPVMIIDTPGIDDEGELGAQRVQKAVQVLNKTDIAILVIDSTLGPDKEDTALLARIKEKKLPVIANGTIRFLDEESEGVIGYVRELEGTKLVVLCNLCEEENKVVWQSEWDSYELLLGNYSDGKVDGSLRPYECKVMRSI